MNRHLVLAVTLMLVSRTAHAVITSDGVGTHVVEAGTPSFGVDLDGVALIAIDVPDSHTVGDLILRCSAALISDYHLLSAAHCYDKNRDGLLDPIFTGIPHVAAFALADRTEILPLKMQETFIPEEFGPVAADLAILTLEEPAPIDIPRYTLYDTADVVGATVVISGYGNTGSGEQGILPEADSVPTKRAGLNRYEALRNEATFPGVELLLYDFDSGQPEHNTMSELGIPSDLGFGPDEVVSAMGDSGGPVFLDGHIVAVTLYGEESTVGTDSMWGAVAYDVPVSDFRDFILTATDNQAMFVPEPAAFPSLLLGTILVWHAGIRRR